MADHELIANDTEPPWEGYLDYVGMPARMANGSPNPDLPPLLGNETLTWVQNKGSLVVTGGMEIVNPQTRHVRHRFTKAETNVPGDWEFVVQIDYPDSRRQTHPIGARATLKIYRDSGGPA